LGSSDCGFLQQKKKKKDRNFKQIKTDPEEKIEETKQLTGQWGD